MISTMSKKQKYYDNLLKTLLEFIEGKRYSPMEKEALIEKLQITSEHLPIFTEILTHLTTQGVLVLHEQKYHLNRPEETQKIKAKGPAKKKARNKEKKQEEKPSKSRQAHAVLTGIIRVHPRGFGFLQPDQITAEIKEVFIPKHLIENAVDGDTVEVEINPDSNWEKGPDGKVLSILKRGRSHLGGTIHDIDDQGRLYIYCPLLGTEKNVTAPNTLKLHVGDRVILKVLHWGDQEETTQGEVTQHLGHISDPSIDIPAAIQEFDLNSIFPIPVVEQAKQYGKEVSKKDLKGREDLTGLTSLTIDPETAKDFDDALSLTKDQKGIYHLAVHIADVAHYVSEGSPLDIEATKRSNSTYFPGFCLPMLPHELSDNLCSLRPDVVRLTVSVLADFDAEGTLISHRIVRSYIKSAKRFSYEEAKEVLDGKLESPHLPTLQLLVELCHLLKNKRSARGSIDFALPELVIVVDEKGEPTGTKYVEYDITHQLVEEYMLKANEIVAKSLADKGKSVVFRIHEEPNAENIEDFYTLARTLGFELPKEPTQQELQEVFLKAKSTSFAQQLSVAFIRSMKLAIYSADNIGHYGLALEHYCHFTSPIRRYNDLIIQRLLFNEEGNRLDVEKIALKSSEQERISFRAETSVKTLKKYRLLEKWMKEDPVKTYQVTVTRIKPFGLSFELPELMLEGFLRISELEDDYFIFNPKQSILVGKSSGKTHRVGEILTVRPESLNLILLQAKWELVTTKRRRKKG